MDYARFNYVAQPEDSIPHELLIPRIGPYDLFATRWGYAPIRGARTPDDERPTLDSWALEQDSVPWFRFSTSGARDSDPGEQTEAIGDADAVQSTALGLRNLQRTMPLLMTATLRRGEDNAELIELYDKLVDQWSTEIEHVVSIVGGSISRERYGGQLGPRFIPVTPARQRAAVRFLSENALKTPRFLLDKEVLRRIEPDGALRRIGSAQSRILAGLLDTDRIDRLSEHEALATKSGDVYTAGELLRDVRRAVWSELGANSSSRRSIQKVASARMAGSRRTRR